MYLALHNIRNSKNLKEIKTQNIHLDYHGLFSKKSIFKMKSLLILYLQALQRITIVKNPFKNKLNIQLLQKHYLLIVNISLKFQVQDLMRQLQL